MPTYKKRRQPLWRPYFVVVSPKEVHNIIDKMPIDEKAIREMADGINEVQTTLQRLVEGVEDE